MIRAARIALIPLAALGLMAFEDYAGLSVQFPTGWTTRAGSSEGMVSAIAPDGRTNCTAHSNPMPGLAGMSQEQIDAEMSKVFGLADWANLAGMDPSTIDVRETESRPVDGTYMQVATIDLHANARGNASPMTIRMATFVLPGRVVGVGCFADAASYPQHVAAFETTVSSLRPR